METAAISVPEKAPTKASKNLGSLARGTGLSFTGEAGHIILTYAYGILIARFLGSGDYGNFFLGMTIFNLICLFVLSGVEDTLMRFIGLHATSGEESQTRTVIRISFLIAIGAGVVLGCACYLLKDILAERIFHKPELAVVMGYISLAVPVFALMTVSVTAIRGYKIVFPYVFVRKIFLPAMSLALAAAVMVTGGGLRNLSLSYLLSVVISAGFGYALLIRHLSPFSGLTEPLADRRRFLSFLGAAYATNILIFFTTWSDLIILGVMTSSEQLGVYFAAKRTAMAIGILMLSLNVILGPVISHLYSGNHYEQLNRAFKTATQWIIILGLPVLVMTLLFPKEILMLFGPGFTEGREALIILTCGQFLNLSVGSVGYMLMMTGNQRWMVADAVGAVVINIPLMILLVSRYGINGAAWASAVTLALAGFVALAQIYFLLKLHPFSIRYVKLLMLASITAGVCWLIKACLPDDASVMLIAGQIGFVFLFFFSLVLVFGLTGTEKKRLFDLRRKPLPAMIREILEGKETI
ncbi:MAG: flippase [Thermodesulfobacteriota bacterium]